MVGFDFIIKCLYSQVHYYNNNYNYVHFHFHFQAFLLFHFRRGDIIATGEELRKFRDPFFMAFLLFWKYIYIYIVNYHFSIIDNVINFNPS